MDTHALPFAKGHGTGNDFVIVPDPDGAARPVARAGRARCATAAAGSAGTACCGSCVRRRAAVAARATEAEWFMDYRNADGSLAEMCGNGVRVYARYLVESGLAHRSAGADPDPGRTGRGRRRRRDLIAVDMPLPRGRRGEHGPSVRCGLQRHRGHLRQPEPGLPRSTTRPRST